MPYSRPVLRALMSISVAAVVPLTQVAPLSPAAAQAAKPQANKPKVDKRKQASKLVEDGLAAQQKGDHDAALALYAKAYELVPHPILLFNMAQANRLAGRPAPARDLYRQYLDAEPNGAKAKTAREFLTAMEAQIAAARAAPAAPAAIVAPVAPAARPDPVAPTPAPTAPLTAPEPGPDLELDAATTVTSAEERSAAGARQLRLAGTIGVGVGVASLGVGVAFHLRARALSSDLSEPGVIFDPDKERSGETAETLAYVGYAAGGALLLGGGALYLLGRRADREHLTFLPSISSDSVGLVVSGGLP